MTTINLGHVLVVEQPALQGAGAPMPQVARGSDPQRVVESAQLPFVDIQRLVGFPILQPTWLPSPDLKLTKTFHLAGPGQEAQAAAMAILKFGAAPERWVVVKQMRYGKTQAVKIGVTLTQGTIDGSPAAFFTTSLPSQSQPGGQLRLLTALWERGDLLLEVHGPNISQADAARIGSSLR